MKYDEALAQSSVTPLRANPDRNAPRRRFLREQLQKIDDDRVECSIAAHFSGAVETSVSTW